MNKRAKKKLQKKRDTELKDKLLWLYKQAEKTYGALVVTPDNNCALHVIDRDISFYCCWNKRPSINLTATVDTQYLLDDISVDTLGGLR